ncbi:MAG: Uncharacterized protein G01um10147_535 [Microgenomates group bacterium Gr01-1014_7]|nr:MAG: Uncharacterized protein G01um10147_535 [Microgenomates group bacterium Gr01-1014_7]
MSRKEWLVAAILTFLTICAWVVFDILHTRAQVEIPSKTKELIEPISPEFDISGLKVTP